MTREHCASPPASCAGTTVTRLRTACTFPDPHLCFSRSGPRPRPDRAPAAHGRAFQPLVSRWVCEALLSVFSRSGFHRTADCVLFPRAAPSTLCGFPPGRPGARPLRGVPDASRDSVQHCGPAHLGCRRVPTIQVVTGSFSRVNVEIKANLYEKAVFSSLNVDRGLELGASPLCPSSRCRAH